MELTFGNYQLINSSREIAYIEDIFKNIETRFKDLQKFFGLESLDKQIQINLWDNLDAFRESEKEKRKDIPAWLCGTARTTESEHIINTLTLEELKKTKGHEDSTLQDLENLILHEIVHCFVRTFVGKDKKVKRWLNEALATSLSNQRHNLKEFNCTMDNLYYDDFVNYSAFHTLGNYLTKEKGAEYVSKLLKDSKFQDDEIPNIYTEVKAYHNEGKEL